MTPLERSWAAALCASGDAVANMGTDALRLVATKKPQDVTSAGIMESTHKLARACRIADATTTSTPAARKPPTPMRWKPPYTPRHMKLHALCGLICGG